jgi:hypothetical protein
VPATSYKATITDLAPRNFFKASYLAVPVGIVVATENYKSSFWSSFAIIFSSKKEPDVFGS